MAPARHETGPPQLDGAGDGTTYGTRSSKRKASEMTSGPTATLESSPPPPKTSPLRAAKSRSVAKKTVVTATEPEPREPPTKKHRSSSTIASEIPSSSSSSDPTPEEPVVEHKSPRPSNPNSSQGNGEEVDQVPGSPTPGPEQEVSSQPVPDVQIEAPSGSNDDDPDADADGEDEEEIPAPEEVVEISNGVPEPTRGRGRGRGRGGRGSRGASRGRGSRGGKVKTGVGARGAKPATSSTRGRGRGRGGRRKKPEDPLVDNYHKRKLDLKSQFKLLAAMQRNALAALADKSIKLMQNDPSYHETLPEFTTVSQRLEAEYKNNLAQDQLVQQQKLLLAGRTQEYTMYLAEQQYRLQIEEIKEKYEHRIMEHATYVYAQSRAGGDLDDIPFSHGEDGRIVKDSWLGPKKVHGTGAPFINPPGAASVSSMRSTLGDNEYEQHPANWWNAKSKKERAAILRKQAECIAERERIHRAETGGRGKKGARQALFQPNAQQETAEGGEAAEGEEDADEQLEVSAEGPSRDASRGVSHGGSRGPSRPPTREGSTPDQNVSEDIEDSDAPPQDIDEYGVSIPRKKVRKDQPSAFNRIVTNAPVIFAPHEIGLRRTRMSKQPDGNLKRLGRDADPNPASGKFYYDQRQSRHNSGKNQPEDLDQEIVATHKIHPRLGLPISGSLNPDHDQCKEPYFKARTDWGAELQPTNPVMFIHTNEDGSRTIARTSRSEWLHRAKRGFEQISTSERMVDLLAASGDLESRPATPVTLEPPQVISNDLLNAIESAAESQKQEEKCAAEEARIQASRPAQQQQMFSPVRHPQTPKLTSPSASVYSPPSAYPPNHLGFSPAQHMPPPQAMPPPSRQMGYDPVRDVNYVIPYSQPQPRQPPPPPPHATYNNGGGALSQMADLAFLYGGGENNDYQSNMPPPPIYHAQAQGPINPYAPPHMHSQPQQPQPQRMVSMGSIGPGMSVFGHQPVHQSPYSAPPPQPNRGGSSGSRRATRELRPAPPAARAPPPPPPQHPPHQPYRGYGGSGYQ